MKTTNEILTDIIGVIITTPIAALNGEVYKKYRPTGSELEDCVVHIIPGSSEKFLRDAALYVKIFYNDIRNENSYIEDALNGQGKEALLIALSEKLLTMNGYSFYVQTRETYTEAVDEIHQHYAILKINFKILH